MKRPGIFLLVALFPLVPLAAQSSGAVITLQESLDAALAKGDDTRILQGSLDVARAQHALNVSRNSFTLSGSAGYNVSTTYGAAIAGRPSASAGGTSPVGGQAGLALAGPLTSVSVSAYPWIPPTGP
jgi:hypothetical protein